jgi:uncharacterized protein YjbI with pentapeptide repeats
MMKWRQIWVKIKYIKHSKDGSLHAMFCIFHCDDMFYNAMFYNALFYNAMFYNAMFYNAMFYNAMFYNAVFNNAVL